MNYGIMGNKFKLLIFTIPVIKWVSSTDLKIFSQKLPSLFLI